MFLQIGPGLGVIPTVARPAPTTAPVNVVKPFFTGILTQGQPAGVDPGEWTGLPGAIFDYAIRRGLVTVSNDPDYIWQAADVAAGAGAMTVVVTAANDVGATSATSDPVTIAAPLQVGGPPSGATVGEVYSFVAPITGGRGPYTATFGGTPPAGLAFDDDPIGIFGTPVSAGTAEDLTIAVTDADGLTATLGPFNLPVTASYSPSMDLSDRRNTAAALILLLSEET